MLQHINSSRSSGYLNNETATAQACLMRSSVPQAKACAFKYMLLYYGVLNRDGWPE